jgi:hypothetical protein
MKPDVGSTQYLGEVSTHRLIRAIHHVLDRISQVGREQIASSCSVFCIEGGRPPLQSLADCRLICS